MGYRILEDDYYVQQVQLPLGVPGVSRYGLRYDPDTGDYVLSQKSAAGYTVGIGLAVLYKNGSWTSDAIQDSKLFVNGDKTRPTALALQLSEDMRRKVYAAYKSVGGQAKGNKVNPTATPDNFTKPPGANNFFPGQQPGISTAIPGSTLLTTPPGSPGSITNILTGFSTPLEFPSVNENDLFGTPEVREKRLLYYPADILDNRQDTLRITQYNYKAPTGEAIFGIGNTTGGLSGVNPVDNIIKGVQRASAAAFGEEDFKGMVVLPIPNNAADNNATSWGPDYMNNLTAAATAMVMANPLGSALGTAAGSLLEKTIGLNPTQAIIYSELIRNAGGLGNLPENVQRQINTAIASLTLKGGGFDVSPEQILARGFGVIPNSNLELLFNNVTLRSFSFGYRLSPRSKEEARNVRRIIRFFKQGMAARKTGKVAAGGASVFLGSPNVFKLEYKTANDKPIPGLNRFKLCALTNFAVNYSPDGQWAAYDGGQPVSVTIGMDFTELEPVYENDYQKDIFGGLKGAPDLDPIGPDDVGY